MVDLLLNRDVQLACLAGLLISTTQSVYSHMDTETPTMAIRLIFIFGFLYAFLLYPAAVAVREWKSDDSLHTGNL